MPVNTDFRLLEEKFLDEETVLKVSQNLMSGRIFVEFTGTKPRMVLQKSFQDSLQGRTESKEFASSIKGIKDLKKYFGLTKRGKK